MPLPLLFIGIAAATGGLGVGKTIKAGIDANNAKKINKNANEIVEASTEWLNAQRMACGNSLRQLGEEKLFILNSSITEFLDTFSKIKNVDFRESEGLEELKKLHVDEKEFVELKSMVSFAGSLAGGAVAGTAGGALAAFGAYGAAQALACASTGTAIASLSFSVEDRWLPEDLEWLAAQQSLVVSLPVPLSWSWVLWQVTPQRKTLKKLIRIRQRRYKLPLN